MNTRSYCTICHTSANDPGPRKLTQNILDKSLQRCDQTQIVIELSMLSFNQQPEMALQAHFEAQHVGLPPQQQPVISSSVSRAYTLGGCQWSLHRVVGGRRRPASGGVFCGVVAAKPSC